MDDFYEKKKHKSKIITLREVQKCGKINSILVINI